MSEKEKIEKVDLIKIDVEGHEAEVLQGLGEYLHQFKPTMVIEILTDEVGAAVEKILCGTGYHYFYFDKTKASPVKVDRLRALDGYNFLVCQDEIANKLGLNIKG